MSDMLRPFHATGRDAVLVDFVLLDEFLHSLETASKADALLWIPPNSRDALKRALQFQLLILREKLDANLATGEP